MSKLKEKKSRYEKTDILDAYRSFFETPSGQIVLMDLADLCGIEETVFHPEPTTHAFREGSRRVVLEIMKKAGISPLEYIARLEDNNEINEEEQII